jgi:hypothetical protein
MKTYLIIATILIIASLGLLVGCNDISRNNIKFDKAKWDSLGDLRSYSYREQMWNDLIAHHQIKGLTYKQVIDSLGQTENYQDIGDSLRYDIVADFGDLDPKSGKYLIIGFNKDSTVTGFKVVEWKNRHANE